MKQEEESSEKPFEPTQRKLDEARKKGEVAKSTDLFVASAYAGFLLVGLTLGSQILVRTGTALQAFLDRPEQMAQIAFSGSQQPLWWAAGMSFVPSVLPWFLVPPICVVAMVVAQKAFTFAPSKLAFKFNRLSPISNAKNKYGRSGLFEFFKSFLKLSVYSICLAIFLQTRLPELSQTVLLSPGPAIAIMFDLILQFALLVLVIATAIGGLDMLFQRADFMRRNRMSLKELKDESKESEGDPHLKQERRQRAQKIATNRMLQDVPEADVVIVNPTHYAVALKWSRRPGAAPECVAKGVDEIAARIREIAIENAVPIHHDPPTARALFATVEIGSQIDRDHYRAVAAAIRFAEEMQQKAARR